MTTDLKSLSDLLPEAAARINRPCEAFDEAWGKGQRPRIEDFLGAAADGQQRVLLFHLMQLDLELRRNASEVPALTDYVRRFPHDAEVIAQAFANARTAPVVSAPTPEELPEVPGFEVLGRLGEGGMGDVYLARDKLDRQVALKLIRCGWGGRGAKDRARDEARALARLQDPQVVTVYDVDEHQGQPYLSLEYVPGGSLADRLKGVPQPPREAAQLMQTLALTIHRIHGRGLAHRDLKPANILLVGERGLPLSQLTPKITDFGLVKYLDVGGGRTSTGLVLGTASYMAPEQARGENDKVDHRADVYALGAILYECLAGRPPFWTARPVETLLQVVSEEPVPVRRLNPAVDEGLAFICMKCLAKDPDGRYHSAAELATVLRCWLDGLMIPPTWQEWLRWLRRQVTKRGRIEDAGLWSRIMGAMAAWTLLGHGVFYLLLLGGPEAAVCWAWLAALHAGSWLVLGRLLRPRLRLDPAERAVMLNLAATVITDAVLFALFCPFWDRVDPARVVGVYPAWLAVRGLMRVTDGHSSWGYYYLLGLGYFVAAPLLPLAGTFVPLLYGLVNGVGLGLLALTLRRLERRAQRPPAT